MRKTVIEYELSEDSISDAIKELQEFQKDFLDKMSQVRDRVAEVLRQRCQSGFDSAVVDDLTAQSGGARYAHVTVTTTQGDDNTTLVVANGEDAVWVEFGAGVHHNGAVGSSPNKYGIELGFSIGSFGANGSKDMWAFTEAGETYWTHGTPATMPMMKAVESVVQEIDDIVKEVFE